MPPAARNGLPLEEAATVPLPALTGGERTDAGAVADAYTDAYEALLAVV